MYTKRTRYSVMDGEPHLGSVVESELIATREEILAAFLEEVQNEGYLSDEIHVIDDVSEYDIVLDTSEHLSNQQIVKCNELCESMPSGPELDSELEKIIYSRVIA